MSIAQILALIATVLAALSVSVILGDVLTRAVLNRRFPPSGEQTPDLVGRTIGRLERLAVTGAILAAQPAVIAVVIAIKGLGRFPELNKDPEGKNFAAKFIIGTLSSFLWAAAVGVIGYLCLIHWDLFPL